MSILQIIPAPAGTSAVFLDLEKEVGLKTSPVQLFALIEDEEGRWVEAMHYTFEGFVPISDIANCLGLLLPGEDADEVYKDMEQEARAEILEAEKGDNN